jgi:hypothetical protein
MESRARRYRTMMGKDKRRLAAADDEVHFLDLYSPFLDTGSLHGASS